jgi:chromate transport protein ChrA
VKSTRIEPRDFDAAYAVSRITPGTNLLALYALLGHRVGGWPLAVQAVSVGALVPAAVTMLLAIGYTSFTSPAMDGIVTGARAGGVAVFLGAAVRLLRPQLTAHPIAGTALTLAVFVAGWVLPISLFVLLLATATAGAILLRPQR